MSLITCDNGCFIFCSCLEKWMRWLFKFLLNSSCYNLSSVVSRCKCHHKSNVKLNNRHMCLCDYLFFLLYVQNSIALSLVKTKGFFKECLCFISLNTMHGYGTTFQKHLYTTQSHRYNCILLCNKRGQSILSHWKIRTQKETKVNLTDRWGSNRFKVNLCSFSLPFSYCL